MRFHIGLSLNWKTIKKWLIPIVIGIAIYLGFNSVNALTVPITPKDIAIGLSNNVYLYPPESISYNNETVFTYSSSTPTDWEESANVFYRYTNFAGSTYCHETSNNGSLSGKIYFVNSEWGPEVDPFVRFEDVVNNTYTDCKSSFSGGTMTFTCNNVNLSHNQNIVLSNVGGGRYGITQNIDILCSMTNEGLSNSITQNNDKNTQDIINSQDEIKEEQKETNDKLDDLNDNITNPNVDKGTGNSFFDNFSTEDNGGISGIITAPLTLINSLLDNQGTCTDLEFPILGKDVSMPSGCIIWDKVPSSIETIIQMLVCGTGAYFILTQLFKDINDLKDPNKQGVSTLDL